jgi:hypothetical protein
MLKMVYIKDIAIEGYFSEKAELNLQESKEQELIEKIKQILINV